MMAAAPLRNPSRHRPVTGTPTRDLTDLRRAVIELATVRGWHSPPAEGHGHTDGLPGLAYGPRASVDSMFGWPDLTLIRRLDRRLVFAALTSDDVTALSPRKRLVFDLLCALRWSADERRYAELAVGHPMPSIEAFVWRPADLLAGTIGEVLR